jgi:hypothetical protein
MVKTCYTPPTTMSFTKMFVGRVHNPALIVAVCSVLLRRVKRNNARRTGTSSSSLSHM